MSLPSLSPFPVVVIGGGISGLSCTYQLRQAGIPARVLDSATRPGGVIGTWEKDGFRFENGPQSFLATQPLLKLIGDLGLEKDPARRSESSAVHSLARTTGSGPACASFFAHDAAAGGGHKMAGLQ